MDVHHKRFDCMSAGQYAALKRCHEKLPTKDLGFKIAKKTNYMALNAREHVILRTNGEAPLKRMVDFK